MKIKNFINFKSNLMYLFFFIVFTISLFPQEEQVKNCLICHGKPGFKKVLENRKIINLYVDETVLKNSVHKDLKCFQCHADITEIPHKGEIKKVNCSQCHYIGNPYGAPQTLKYKEYYESIHSVEVLKGNQKAPVCQECHGNHNIRKTSDSESNVSRINVASTCGKCHLNAFAVYSESIHGKAIKNNKLDSATCIDCHGEHRILSILDSPEKISLIKNPKTCSQCHSKKEIMDKYGIKVEQVITYEESFHGVANKFGSKAVATCVDCHGYHEIKKRDDPTSLIHPANLPQMCGKCHPGANINFTRGKIHIAPKEKEAGIVYYISNFFKWLTLLVMIGLLSHLTLDFIRKIKEKKLKNERK